jgi:hypothetical protein
MSKTVMRDFSHPQWDELEPNVGPRADRGEAYVVGMKPQLLCL